MRGAGEFIFRWTRCSASTSRHPTFSAARYVDGFVPLMRFQAERARATYQEALALLPAADRKAQRPGLMMGAIYSALLARDRARKLSGIAPAHCTDTAAKAVDRVAHVGARLTRSAQELRLSAPDGLDAQRRPSWLPMESL